MWWLRKEVRCVGLREGVRGVVAKRGSEGGVVAKRGSEGCGG